MVRPFPYQSRTDPILPPSTTDAEALEWYLQRPDPVFPEKDVNEYWEGPLEDSLFVEPETVSLDMWFKEASQPVRAIARFAPTLFVQPLDSTLFAVDAIDWFRLAEQPIFGKVPPAPTLFVQPLDSTLFAVDAIDWFRLVEQPIFGKVPPAPTLFVQPMESSLFTEPGEVTVDMWFRPIVQPIFPEKDINEYWEGPLEDSVFVEPETVTLDMWFKEIVQPVRLIERVAPTLFTQPLEDTLFPRELVDWFRLLEQPIFRKPPLTPGSWNGVLNESLFEIEDITLDKWFRPTEQPIFRTWQITPNYWGGSLNEDLFQAFSFDWYVPTSQPFFPPPPVTPTWFTTVEDPDTPVVPQDIILDVYWLEEQVYYAVVFLQERLEKNEFSEDKVDPWP